MIKKVVKMVFPCKKKVLSAYNKHKDATNSLITEIKQATKQVAGNLEKDIKDNIKG